MNLFLRARHWQIFVITFGIPFLAQAIFMFSIFSSLVNSRNPDPTIIFGYFKFFPVLMLLFMGGTFGWFWSIAIGLQKMVPPETKMKTVLFKVFFFIPLIYIFCVLASVGLFFNADILKGTNEPPLWIFGAFAIILPVHFFSMFCIFYCMFFAPKTLKTVELKRAATFSDFVGEFFLMWFNFIGIWILQPRINKIVQGQDDNLQTAAEMG